ncbi:hypothetical protein AZO1586R_871 [Bathymodiolus azoricus thioautotrophic gill symbiont]|jgi:hypothetical protein|uniref:Uncharacterized protein n=1 Tax=Bathymodiolus azoricus thioautotrophic gill symbiont TaxID=235205 RepID=A0ACA8ZPG3_9GAMM|nr:hypothetical protein AZO1586R_871 [Bathymodiolus azoricus thioautotrophic gill symbiont]
MAWAFIIIGPYNLKNGITVIDYELCKGSKRPYIKTAILV